MDDFDKPLPVICLGSYHSTTLLSARIVVIFSLIHSLLIYQFYSGALVSFLLMQTSTTIRTITDIDNSGMNVGCEDILYIHDFFNVISFGAVLCYPFFETLFVFSITPINLFSISMKSIL